MLGLFPSLFFVLRQQVGNPTEPAFGEQCPPKSRPEGITVCDLPLAISELASLVVNLNIISSFFAISILSLSPVPGSSSGF
jgi:hypothetical protein